jgi:hypothetical protein
VASSALMMRGPQSAKDADGAASTAALFFATAEIDLAAGAELAAIARHAGGDEVHVRNVLLTQPHGIAFAGSALLRGSLRTGR